MVLTFLLLVVTSLTGQVTKNETSFSGVYQGSPLFIQNPYLSDSGIYCISRITINKRRVEMNYERSALILDFKGINKFSPVSIHIEYSDSTCVPILLNPESIRYHNTFSFEELIITDSSLVWKATGESDNGTYEVEAFDLGYWEVVSMRETNGDYGGSEYTFFPIYVEGVNKYRVKYTDSNNTLYSEEIEHVFYPEPVTVKHEGNKLTLSRSVSYVITDKDNIEAMVGAGKEVDITDLKYGEYYILIDDKQGVFFRKSGSIKVIKKYKKPDNQ